MRLPGVDGLRAIAILSVILCHASIFPPFTGARGVDLFFVISGFCLSLPFLEKGRPLVASRFWMSRLWRIGPPYWVALAIFAAWALSPWRLPILTQPQDVLGEYVRDAAFQTGMMPGLNGTYWTLGLEARWYVLFPFILALYLRSRVLFAALMVGFYLWYLSPWCIPDAGILPTFMLGIVAADLMLKRKLEIPALVPIALVLVAAAIYFDRGRDHGDPLWQVTVFVVVLAGVGPGAKALSWKPLALIGVASYSIYLVHAPFVYWLWLHHVPPIARATIAIALGFAFWRCVEVPSLALRTAVLQRPALDGASMVQQRT